MEYNLLSLHISLPRISNPSDILAYAVRHYLYTPSNIFESFLDYEYTFAKQFVKYQHLPEEFAETVKQDLTSYITQIFETSNIDVATAITYIKNPAESSEVTTGVKNFYSLSIDAKIIVDNKLHSISSNIEITDKKDFIIHFDSLG